GREGAGDSGSAGTGEIEPGRSPLACGRTDDAAVHEPGACRFDDAADLACRLRRYRIAVDVDSAESGGGNGAGQLDGAVRWDHGEDDAARFHEVRQSSRVFEATL